MATVMHGRRKGTTKSPQNSMAPNTTLGFGQQEGSGMMLPNGTDLRQVKILSKAEWHRMNMQLHKKEIEEERMRRAREEREMKKNLSKEQVKNWENTIAGQRQKRLQARRIREEKEEEERQAIDIEEAQFQAQKRKEAIEKAKTQQYYQTDRVKGFHGALMLTEVLKEREAQLELKRLKERANDGKDQEYIAHQRQEYEQGVLKDQEHAIKRFQDRREVAAFQQAQIREHLKERLHDLEDDRKEGEELKRLAIQYQLEKQRLDDIRREEVSQNMTENLKQIEDVKKMRDVQREMEEEEDEECRVFAAAKRKMMKLRAEKERQLHNEKQERLQRIRDRLGAQMKQKVDDEDSRIRRAVEESEAKRAAEEAEKEAKNLRQLKEMAEHRYTQLREKEEKEAEERAREIELLRIRQEADNLFQRNEDEKKKRRKNEALHLQGFHCDQAGERAAKERVAREEQLEQDAKNMELLQIEENQFQEYAQKVIGHCERGGRNVYPLRKAAQEGAGGGQGPIFEGKGGIRPSYMVMDKTGVQLPNYQRETTEQTKRNIFGDGRTDKRLGFVWSRKKEVN